MLVNQSLVQLNNVSLQRRIVSHILEQLEYPQVHKHLKRRLQNTLLRYTTLALFACRMKALWCYFSL